MSDVSCLNPFCWPSIKVNQKSVRVCLCLLSSKSTNKLFGFADIIVKVFQEHYITAISQWVLLQEIEANP